MTKSFLPKKLLVVALLCMLSACATKPAGDESPGPASRATGLQTQEARITEERVLGDRKTIEAQQLRLRKLNESGIPQNFYPLAKAQCWLDTAKTQYHENDRTGYIEESLTESEKIIKALETNSKAQVGFDTPLVARSSKIRDDLWLRLSGFKAKDESLACNARTVACAEVRLVRAGHADQQTGWRAATPHVQMVEDALRKAEQEAKACEPVLAQAPLVSRAAPAPGAPLAPAVVPVAVVKTVTQTITKEIFVVLGDALFKFDKSGRDEMLPGGLQRLQAVADRLKTYQAVHTLTITGHTDRYGTDAYNDPLSQRRAATVQSYLTSLNVRSDKFDAVGKGKREPVTTDCSTKVAKAEQIICLQPDRRVTIEVTGVVK
jgi:OmpA-OmpF porin, OOP family